MKRVIVLFVSIHSYTYDEKMVCGLAQNGCPVLAVVSSNMQGIENWRKMRDVTLFEVDGYTKASNFIIKLVKFYLIDAVRLKRSVRQFDGDVIYVPHCTFWTYFLYLTLRWIPVVYTMHDPEVHNTGTKTIKVIALFNDYFGKKAKKIILLSRTFFDFVKEKYNKKDNDIILIPSGYESIDDKKCKPIVNYCDDKYNFLFYGAITKHKGLNILAEAYKKLSEKYETTLTIAGNGDFSPYRKIYENLKNCTIINRWIEDDEVNGLFNSKKVVIVLPYLEATQSGVINVAMPLGVPIIATKCGGMIEQINDGITGFLVEPNDAEALLKKMEYVIQHWNQLDTIRDNAKIKISKLGWGELSKELSNVIESID